MLQEESTGFTLEHLTLPSSQWPWTQSRVPPACICIRLFPPCYKLPWSSSFIPPCTLPAQTLKVANPPQPCSRTSRACEGYTVANPLSATSSARVPLHSASLPSVTGLPLTRTSAQVSLVSLLHKTRPIHITCSVVDVVGPFSVSILALPFHMDAQSLPFCKVWKNFLPMKLSLLNDCLGTHTHFLLVIIDRQMALYFLLQCREKDFGR